MPDNNFARLRAPLEAIMREAGDLARETSRRPFKRWTKGDDDSPVSEGDIAVNKLLHARLGALAPGIGWLSEESDDLLPDRATQLGPLARAWIVGSRPASLSR